MLRRILGLVLSIGIVALSHRALLDARSDAQEGAEAVYVPTPAALGPMSLGYKEALADLLWMRALIFTGSHLGGHNVHAIERYVDAIASLSPRFHQAYTWGGVATIYAGSSEVTRTMVDGAIAIYERGLEQYPESHRLLFPLGMLLLHQVQSTPGYAAEERAALAQRGAEHIRRAAAYGADPLVRQYAATLIRDHAGDELARQFLESQLATAEDEGYRRLLRKKLAELGGIQDIAALERVREAFTDEWQRHMPYASDALYAVIRDEQAGPGASADTAGSAPR